MNIKITSINFKQLSNLIHHNKYIYVENYINSKLKIKIICPIHGEFYKLAYSHIKLGEGCHKCSFKEKTKTHDDFVKDANKIHHNRYKYYDKYVNDRTKIKITCLIHGEFNQTPNNHLRGNGCPFCKGGIKKNHLYFINKSNIIHNKKYTYPQNYINAITKIDINCPIHGLFKQTPHDHLSGRGCPKCKQSIGEKQILNYLNSKNINYISEKKFKNCKYKKTLLFDFYLPDYNTCIEYDGEQHYNYNNYFGGIEKFKTLQIRDNIKNEYCKNNNINLIRIRFDENIDEKLNEFLINF